MRDFRLIHAAAVTAASLALAAGLGGCGQDDSELDADAQGQAAQPVQTPTGQSDTQAAVEQARADARAATEATGAGDPLANLSDESPEDAMRAYLAALAAGDFIRAAEYTHPDAPGTTQLRKTGEGFARAMEDPEVQGMNLAGFLTQGLDQATFEVLEQEGEDRVTFEISVPDKPPVLMDVVKLGEGWRVVPPDSGLPSS